MKNKFKKEALLKVKDLKISFTHYEKGIKQKTSTVIDGLDLEIYPKEIVAVLGSSGSGKSLLAHDILGILPSNAMTGGDMIFEGEPLTQKRKEALRGKDIAIIPQSINYLDPLMKVGKQVQLSISGTKLEKKQEQRKIFEDFGLGKEVDSLYPYEISGGMARRVLVATAVVSPKKLIIADEPTPGLDEKALAETLDYFRHAARTHGAGVMIITHDIEAALAVADRIAVFYAGTTLEIANAEDFSGNGEALRHPYTKALWQALPKNGFIPMDGSQPLPTALPKGCLYAGRCEKASAECKERRPENQEIRNGMVRCIHGA